MYTTNLTNTEINPNIVMGADRDSSHGSEPMIITLASAPHWALFDLIQSATGLTLSSDEKSSIVNAVKIKKLRKRQFFLQQSDVCKYTGFIAKGSTRMFSTNEKGQEAIISFNLENSFIVDHDSFTYGAESIYHIEAMEDTTLLLISVQQLNDLMSRIPAFKMMFHRYQLDQLISIQKRVYSALSMSAEARYNDLLSSTPEYAQRFSQNMIACYLGVKAETLSRIRNK